MGQPVFDLHLVKGLTQAYLVTVSTTQNKYLTPRSKEDMDSIEVKSIAQIFLPTFVLNFLIADLHNSCVPRHLHSPPLCLSLSPS